MTAATILEEIAGSVPVPTSWMRAGEVLLMADSLREEEQRLPSVFADSFIQFLVGLALFIALLYRQEGVIYLLLLVMAMMFGAKLWCRLSLSGIECRLKADKQKVFPSEKITMTVEVKTASFCRYGCGSASRWKGCTRLSYGGSYPVKADCSGNRRSPGNGS